MPKVLLLDRRRRRGSRSDVPYQRLLEEGYEVDVAAPTVKDVAVRRPRLRSTASTRTPRSWAVRGRPMSHSPTSNPSDYVAVVVPGGRAPEYLRNDPDVRRILKHFFDAGCPGGGAVSRPADARGRRCCWRAVAARRTRRLRSMSRRRADVRRRTRCRRRQPGDRAGMARSSAVVPGVHGAATGSTAPCQPYWLKPQSSRPIAWPYMSPEPYICTTTSRCAVALGARRRSVCCARFVKPVLPTSVPG